MIDLITPRGEKLPEKPWNVYPRPQLRRNSYVNLNGLWDFTVTKGLTPESYDRQILLPYCPESALSGIKEHFAEGASLWYHKSLPLPEGFESGRILLHIGAADQVCDVFVNGHLAGHHEGGYEAFSCDLTEAKGEILDITIRCRDDLNDRRFPYGKQVMERGGMWYTPVSGIWQTVWLERVPETYIQKLTIKNVGYGVTIDTGLALPGTVEVEGLGCFPLEKGKVTITPDEPHLWSPEDPWLYSFTVKQGEDTVESYFAIRCLEVKTVGKWPRLCLNGKPYFFHGLLDQGYWPESLLTAPSPESYVDDIVSMKALGFNMLRKHIKVEAEEFYYQCDKLGMVVFQDMVNNGDYQFFRDTALPTAGLQRLPDTYLHKDPETRTFFLNAMEATVRQLENHPSIFYWTIFNEGWGQFCADEVYHKLRALDDSRWIDSTSGWFRRKQTDVDSRHVYFRKVVLKGGGKKPLVLSEFGGKTYRAENHIFNPEKVYGYGCCETLEDLAKAMEQLYLEEVLPCIGNGLCAAVYTQVSDVEDEINGLLTYDRKVCKVTPQTMLPIARKLQEAVKG